MAANDQSEIKKLLTEIHSVISKVASAGKQQIDVNRQLLKVMTVIDSGFAKSADDAKELVAGVTGALEDGALVSDDFIKKWAKARKAQKKDLDDLTKRFKEIDEISEDTIENSKTYIDLLKQQHGLIDDEVDLTKKLLANHEAIVRAVSQAKKEVNKFGGALSNSEQIINELVAKKTDLSGMFGGVNESVVNAMGLVEKMQSDINTMVGNVSGQIIDFKLNFNPITGELNDEVAKILNSVKLEKDARLDGLKQYFAQNDKLQKNATRGRALEDLQQNVKFNVEAPDFDKIIGTSQISIDVNTGEIQTATGILKEGTKQYEQLISRLDEIAANNKITDKLKVDFDEIVNLIQLGTSRTAEQEKALRSLTVPLGISTQLLTDQIRLQYDEIDAINSQVEAQTRIHKTMASYMGQLEKAEKAVSRIGSGFDYVNAMLPAGIGDFLGISKVSAVLLDSHQKGAKAFSDEISRGGDSASALNSYFKQMEPAISLALNPMTMLIASVVLLGTFVSSVVEKYKDMAANMKISLLQAKELLNVQLDILSSQKNQFLSMQDIQEVQTAMIGSSGALLDLQSKSSKELVISLSEIGKAFGYGNEQAVKLHKVFSNLGASDKLSVQLQTNLGYMAEMAGLSPQIVTDDLIDSADAVATYFAGMPDKAAKAVIQVRRMGLSLKQAGDIAQKMLDLEGFMTDMYELQSMSSGGIDFSKAFDKGLMGDIPGMTKEIMENIGSTAKYDKMDYLTRMKIAKTLGMSADELGKSVNLHEKMNGMTQEQKDLIEANLDRMGDTTLMSQKDIEARLQQLQATDRLGVAWDKIKAVLVKSILPLVESFASVIDMISPVLDIVVLGFKSIAAAIGVVTKAVSYILTPLSMIGNGISGLIGKFDAVSDSVNGLGEFASGVVKILGGLATIGIGTMIFKSIGMLKNGLFSLIEMIPGIGKIFTGMGNIIGGMFGGIGKKSADAIGESKTSVETLNTNVKTSIGDMVTSVKTAMGEITTSIQNTFSKLSGATGKGIDATSQQMQRVVGDISAKTAQSNQTIVSETEKSGKRMQKSLESTTKGGIAQSEMLSTGVKTSIDNMVTSVKTAMNEIVISIQTTFNKLNGTAVKGINSNSQQMQQVVTEIASTTVQSSQTIATETEKSSKKLKKSLTETTSDGITKVEELQKTAKKGIFSSDTAKSTFGTIGKIGAATLSGMAAGYVGKLMGIGKAVEGATGEATQASLGQFDAMFGIAGAMATQYLGEGIERVFRKKMEGTFESGFEPVLKKARKGLGKLEEPLIGAFKNAGQEGQSVFQKIGSFAKNIFGKKLEPEIDTKQITKTTETISDVTNKVQELATSKTTDVAENIVRNKTEEITEQLPQKKEKVKLPEPDAPIKKIKSSDKTISLPDVDPKQEKQLTGKLSGISDFIKSAFSNLGSVLKSVWQTIKGTLTEITKFVADTMKTLSAGIGTSIKNVLNGIGDGLSSFKTSAVKGAASLIIVSGALWITSKAFQNFAGVNWGDVGKGIVTLGSLTVAALMLGKISGQVIIGAAAIALLGASLIPAAYALNQFNEVDWSSLAKAGVAMVGLGVIGTALSALAPEMVIGAIGIAAVGASLYLTAAALEKFNGVDWSSLAKAGVAMVGLGVIGTALSALAPEMVIGAIGIAAVGASLYLTAAALEKFNGVDWSSLAKAGVAMVGFAALGTTIGVVSPFILAGAIAIGMASGSIILFSGSLITLNASMKALNPSPLIDLGTSLMELTKVSVSSLFGLSAGLISISDAMFTLNAMSGIQSLFGGGFVKDLQIVGNLANPLYIVANSIGSLVTNLIDLTKVLENVDLTNIEKLKNFDEIGVDAKITRQIEPLTEIQPKVERDNTQVKISPIQTPLVKPFAPSKQSVAQDVQVKEPKRESVAQDVKIEYPKFNQNNIQQGQFEKQKPSDNYSNDEIGDLSKVEMLLMKLNQLMELQLKQQLVVHMDGQRVGNIIKKQNNS